MRKITKQDLSLNFRDSGDTMSLRNMKIIETKGDATSTDTDECPTKASCDETGNLCLTDHKCTDQTQYLCYTEKQCYTQDDCDTDKDCQTNIYCDTVDGCGTGVCDTMLTKCSPCYLSSKCEEETEKCQANTRKCGDTITQAIYCCALTENNDQCVAFTKQCRDTDQCLVTMDDYCNTEAVMCVKSEDCHYYTEIDCEETDVCAVTNIYGCEHYKL